MSAFDTPAGGMSLVSKTALDDPRCRELGLIFTKEQFERLDYQAKRRYAAAAESDEVNGKTDSYVVQAFFVCQRTLDEFE